MEPKLMLLPALTSYSARLLAEQRSIPKARRELIHRAADYLVAKLGTGPQANVTVICTHNSRRSHIGQLWLAAAAHHFGLDKLYSFSGGTEATAVHPNTVNALRKAGFAIEQKQPADLPAGYEVQWSADQSPAFIFSKRYDHPANPQSHFAALLVCAEADEACPLVSGADIRIALPYGDPKAYDGSKREAEAYDQSVRQIGTEMLFLVQEVARQLRP